MPTIDALLASGSGNAPALLAPGRPPATHDDLRRQLHACRQALRRFGFGPQSRIAVCLPNGPEAASATLGIAAAAVCAPQNPGYRPDEFRFYLEDTRADAVVVARDGCEAVRAVADELGLGLLEIDIDPREPAGCFAMRLAAAPRQDRRDSRASPAPAEDVALILHTSGTTSRPKIVPLSQANLVASARNIARHLGLRASDRGLNLMPLFHIHGIVGSLMASLSSGGSLVCPAGFDADAFADWAAEFAPTWYTAVPTIHQAIAANGERYRARAPRHRFRFARSSSAPLSPSTLEALESVLEAPVVEAYGMTEASHQMASNPLPPGLRKPGSVGLPAGAEIAILDETGRELPVGDTGEIAIRGPGVMAGYEGSPQANASAFVQGWFRTGDQGRFDADGYLYVSGRLKEIVNRGGEKISPREVDEALLAHPDVAQAVAFAVPHPSLGEDLAAAVVPKPGRRPAEAELRQHLFERLAAFKVPSRIVLADSIPKGPTGKIQRTTLHKNLGGLRDCPFVPPRTATEATLEAMFREVLGSEVLGSEPLGVEANFFARGGDSLLATRLIGRVNRRLSLAMTPSEVFRHPTIASLASAIDAARPPGDAAPEAACPPARPSPPAPAPAPAEESDPLSFAQEALWFLDRRDGPGATYNVPICVRLAHLPKLDALEHALRALAMRHEPLRTCFVSGESGPLQRVDPDAVPDLVVEHIEHGTLESRRQRLQERLRALASEPFDLGRAPLMRARLIRVDGEGPTLLIVLHHAAADGWSRAIVARELGALYDAFAGGRAPALPPLPLRYRDYARAQRELARSGGMDESLGYWTRQLAGLAPLRLPTDRPARTRHVTRGGEVGFRIPGERLAALRTLAASAQATPFMVLLAAFEILLSRHAGQADIAVGTATSGRLRPELEGLVGHFANTLVMRTDLSGNPGFRDALARVRQTTLDALAHQALPFDLLVRALSPQREPGRNPLFRVAFVLQNTPREALELDGRRAFFTLLHTGTAKFDLSLSITQDDEGAAATLEYDADLFERASIERMARHFARLLDSIAEDPAAPIGSLALVDPEEAARQCRAWNDTSTPYPEHETLHSLVEAQARQAPAATAIVTEAGQRVGYASLNRRANRIAHRLRRLDTGRDTPVGLCIRRGEETIVAMLGILKAGAAYLAIDPDYPAARMAFMLSDANAATTLVDAEAAAALAESPTRLLRIDDPSLEAEPGTDPEPLAGPDDLACLFYTSGSTGSPKAVMVPHRAIVRLVRGADYLSIGAEDCIAQASNVSFDAASFEIWGALTNGARLAIVPTDALLSAPALKRRIARDRIDTMFVTTALLNEHARNAPDTFTGLRTLLFGGEAVDPRAVARILRGGPPARLLHVYGPTEAATFATWHEVPRALADGEPPDTIPIGKPIANTTCFVLDENRQPCPVGVTGELWIGGPGLARGYVGHADLSAARFVDGAGPGGERLYRTGDLARRLADGALVFCGRLDEQLKLRGFRVEPAEIRAALAAIPGIAGNALIVREDPAGDRRLVAFLVWEKDAERMDGARLRASLAARLPAFMIPTDFADVDSIPLTPNGKVDHAALPDLAPAPRTDGASVPATCPEPADPLEAELRSIWGSVLGRPELPLDANFFDLGGHSLLAVRVLARIEQRLGMQLRAATLFEAPTIRQLAALLRAGEHAGARANGCVVRVKAGQGGPALFFVPGWRASPLSLGELAKGLDADHALYALDTGHFGADGSARSMEGLAASMIADMRRVQPSGPYRIAGHSLGGMIAHEIGQQLAASGEQVALLALADARSYGLPKRRSAAVLTLLHLRAALSLPSGQRWSYVSLRARSAIRRALGLGPALFPAGAAAGASVTQAMEHSARVVHAAWAAYRPRPYPGRVTLIRAERNEVLGKLRDDPTYGWAALSGAGVELRTMRCSHGEMLVPPHAAELGRILSEQMRAPEDAMHLRCSKSGS